MSWNWFDSYPWVLCLNSKPADFGIGDLDQNPISKPVDHSSSVLPDPQATVIQSDPVVEDAPVDKSEEALTNKQKEVEVEKTSSATISRSMLFWRDWSVVFIVFLIPLWFAEVQTVDLPKSAEIAPNVDQLLRGKL